MLDSTAQSFQDRLIQALKKDSRFIDQDDDLLKSEVIDKAWKLDKGLIELLLDLPESKTKFFDAIKECLIFNVMKFIDYIQDKN